MSRYHDLDNDVHVPGRWHLRGPFDSQGQEINPWQFREGHPLTFSDTLHFRFRHEGVPLDWTFAGLSIPLLNERTAALLKHLKLQDIQLFPARVESRPEPYFVLNITRIVKCIDDARCEQVLYWLPEDERPDKTGKYRSVYGLRIDPTKVGEARIFRPWGWQGVIIVSQDIKGAFEREGLTGVKFFEV
jgi:hypothetical protein